MFKDCGSLVCRIVKYIAASTHGSHIHLVVTFVREASLCAATNRDETLCSFFAVCRSVNHYDLNMEISENEIELEREIFLGQFRTKDVHDLRENEKSGDTERSEKDRN